MWPSLGPAPGPAPRRRSQPPQGEFFSIILADPEGPDAYVMCRGGGTKEERTFCVKHSILGLQSHRRPSRTPGAFDGGSSRVQKQLPPEPSGRTRRSGLMKMVGSLDR